MSGTGRENPFEGLDVKPECQHRGDLEVGKRDRGEDDGTDEADRAE